MAFFDSFKQTNRHKQKAAPISDAAISSIAKPLSYSLQPRDVESVAVQQMSHPYDALYPLRRFSENRPYRFPHSRRVTNDATEQRGTKLLPLIASSLDGSDTGCPLLQWIGFFVPFRSSIQARQVFKARGHRRVVRPQGFLSYLQCPLVIKTRTFFLTPIG